MSDTKDTTTLEKNNDCSCFLYVQNSNDEGPGFTHLETCQYYGTGLHCKPLRQKVQKLIDQETNKDKQIAVRICEETFIKAHSEHKFGIGNDHLLLSQIMTRSCSKGKDTQEAVLLEYLTTKWWPTLPKNLTTPFANLDDTDSETESVSCAGSAECFYR